MRRRPWLNEAMQTTLLYRMYFAPKTLIERLMAKHAWLRAPVERAKRGIRRFALPRGEKWVTVRAGLCAGAKMRLHFPEEAGVWLGEHEPEVQRAIAAVVRPGWVVFDVGAAIGVFALGAAKLAGDGGRVVAFEADPVQAARLSEHVSANGLDSAVTVVHAAVWSNREAASIGFRCGEKMRTQGGVEAEGYRPILGRGELIEVPATSLDAYCAEMGATPRLIKIDVEGGEIEVLRGAEETIARSRPLIVAEIHSVEARDFARGWMREHGYAARETLLGDPIPIRLLAWPSEGETAWAAADER